MQLRLLLIALRLKVIDYLMRNGNESEPMYTKVKIASQKKIES